MYLLLKHLCHIHRSLPEQISIKNLVVHKNEKVALVFFVVFMNQNVFLPKNKNKLKLTVKASELDISDYNNHKMKCQINTKYANEVSTLSPLERKQLITILVDY